MIELVNKLIKLYCKIHRWLCQKSIFQIQRSAWIILISFVFGGGILHFCSNKNIQNTIVSLVVILMFSILLFFDFDTEDKKIKKLTKNKYRTPRELMKQLSHGSYVYGLIVFIKEPVLFLTVIIWYIASALEITNISIKIFEEIWIASLFVFSFFYFGYHMSNLNEKKTIQMVDQMLQLYIAIGTTISFIMLVLGENYYIKVIIGGLLLQYTWLEYYIGREKNKMSKV